MLVYHKKPIVMRRCAFVLKCGRVRIGNVIGTSSHIVVLVLQKLCCCPLSSMSDPFLGRSFFGKGVCVICAEQTSGRQYFS